MIEKRDRNITLEQESQDSNIGGDDNSWLYSLPDDLKTSESLKKFKDISSLANSYLSEEDTPYL